MSTETWRPVVGFEGRYEVSDLGRVRSLSMRLVVYSKQFGRLVERHHKGRIRKLSKNTKGYPIVTLGSEKGHTKAVHKLVAIAWLGPYPEGAEVNHKNGIKTDCRKDNLEYVTGKQNVAHSFDTGLHSGIGETHFRAVLTVDLVRKIRALPKSVKSRHLAKQLGLPYDAIRKARKGTTWKHVTTE